MGIPDSVDPGNGPALPDVPYLTVDTLAARFLTLTRDAAGLALPWIVTIDEVNQAVALEFGPDRRTYSDLGAWATRFGAVVEKHACGLFDHKAWHVTVTFPYAGAVVTAFAFIPMPGQEGLFRDQHR